MPTLDETVAAISAVLAAVDAGADHFTVLQLPVDASSVQIRDAYFRLARVIHPDSPRIAHDPGLRRLAARAFQLVSAANATLADPERRQVYVGSLARSVSTARRTSGAYQVPADLVGHTHPSSPTHPIVAPALQALTPGARPSASAIPSVAPPLHAPTPRAGTVPANRPAMVPEPLAWRPPTPVAPAPVPPQGLVAPADTKAAAACVDVARIQLGRRDWAGAQETLQLALPVLTEPTAIAECKVLLGAAIFSNLSNAESFRLEHSKRLWNEVVVHNPNTPQHAQAAYHLAIWHKLHGEPQLVLHNLQSCLELLPEHQEALREKRLLSKRQFTMSDLADLEARARKDPPRRDSSGKRPAVTAQIAKPSWLARLFGAKDAKH